MGLSGKINWTESSSTIAAQRADAVNIWPFDPSFPVSVTFQVFGERQPVRLNRHIGLTTIRTENYTRAAFL